MYYLDTNVIITLGKKIKKVPSISKCITSSLTIMEILKNLNKSNYLSKRSHFKNIDAAQINIDWDTPTQKMDSAFGYPTVDPLSSKIKGLFEKIISTDNYINFNTEQNKEILKEVNSYLKLFNEQLRSVMNSSGSNQLTQENIKKGYITKEEINSEQSKQQMYELLLMTLSSAYSYLGNIRYNKSLDSAIFIQIEQTFDFLTNNKKLKHNDTIDHYHFYYFQNKTFKMVSADKHVLDITRKALGSRKAITIEDFKDK